MKVFYNNSIAKALLAKGYSTIMLLGCVLTKYTDIVKKDPSFNFSVLNQYFGNDELDTIWL